MMNESVDEYNADAGDPTGPTGEQPVTEQPVAGEPEGPLLSPDDGAVPAPALVVRPKRVRRLVSLIVLIVVGIGAIAGGAVMLSLELSRGATSAEAIAAGQLEVATRWQRLPASGIFPATVSYPDSEGMTTNARLVGIAPAASCQAALDETVATSLRKHGCITVLRATYVDASGTMAVTAGVAVMASASVANQVAPTLPGNSGPGVRAVTFSGTIAGAFGDSQRNTFSNAAMPGPYLFFFAAGYADGRVLASVGGNPELSSLGYGVMAELEKALTKLGKPCEMKDVRC